MRTVKKILVDSASPETCTAILLSMRKGARVGRDTVIRKARIRNPKVEKTLFRTLNRLKDLGVVEETTKNQFVLTAFGNNCKDLLIEDPSLFFEFMHHLHVRSAFDDSMDGYFLTYYLVTEYLFMNRKIEDRRILLSSVLAGIEKTLGPPNVKSIDQSSISKVISWLRVLEPPFAQDDGTFRPRENVRPHALNMAISAYYDKVRLPFGTPIMLYGESIREICCMGLIDEKHFSSSISRASALFPDISLSGTVDGKALLLRKRFDIGEII